VVPAPAADPEFTLLLAQARLEAKILIGPDPARLLPIIQETGLRRAIGDALPALLDTLEGDERNVLLTLVRMWRTLATGEFVSKDVAAEWAMERLPAGPAALVACAREAYLGRRTDDWQTQQHEVRQVADDLSRRVMAML
jgi:streptomycin 3"-adenylyltransferase